MNFKEGIFLLTVEEVADILRLQPVAIVKMFYSGQIRSIRIGAKTIRVRKTEPYRYINAKESQRLYTKGMKFKNIGDFKNAIACLKDATSIYTLNKPAHFELGKIYYDNIKKDKIYYDLAKQRFEKGLEIDFEDRNTHLYLSKMKIIPQKLNFHNPYQMEEELLSIKDLADAFRVEYLKAYEMVINDEIRGVYIGRWKIRKTQVYKYLDKQESELFYKLAMNEKEVGRIDDAIEYFKESTRIYPLHKNAHLQLAEIYLQKTKFDKIYKLWALDRFKKAFNVDTEDLEVKDKIKELERTI
ncbi:MAG: hypothetical protein AB1567_00625 [bacterium]